MPTAQHHAIAVETQQCVHHPANDIPSPTRAYRLDGLRLLRCVEGVPYAVAMAADELQAAARLFDAQHVPRVHQDRPDHGVEDALCELADEGFEGV